MANNVAAGVRALRERRAVADLSGWTKALTTGPDAGTFLGDVVTGPVEALDEGGATRSLLLTPTGRVRADFTVARIPEGFLLVQSPEQPSRIDMLLSPYVLSSDVEIQDRTDRRLAAVVAREPPDGAAYAPGALGTGADVWFDGSLDAAFPGLTVADPAAVETWRILEGRPRFGPDLTPESIPAEAALEDAIDFTKGCFLGQESVAKTRNLGHPPFVLLARGSDASVEPGAAVSAGERAVGVVTSAAEDPDGGFATIVRVRWDAREAALATDAGPLRPGRSAPG